MSGRRVLPEKAAFHNHNHATVGVIRFRTFRECNIDDIEIRSRGDIRYSNDAAYGAVPAASKTIIYIARDRKAAR